MDLSGRLISKLVFVAVIIGFAFAAKTILKPRHEFPGLWVAYSPWGEIHGLPMSFTGSTFELAGPVDHFYPTTIDVTGTYTVGPGTIQLVFGNYVASDLLRRGDDVERQRLLQTRTFNLTVEWVNDNVVRLRSGKQGPGPEGEVNFVLSRNGETPATILTSCTWLPSYQFNLQRNPEWRSNFGRGSTSEPAADAVLSPPPTAPLRHNFSQNMASKPQSNSLGAIASSQALGLYAPDSESGALTDQGGQGGGGDQGGGQTGAQGSQNPGTHLPGSEVPGGQPGGPPAAATSTSGTPGGGSGTGSI
jgi:hypothetical protein